MVGIHSNKKKELIQNEAKGPGQGERLTTQTSVTLLRVFGGIWGPLVIPLSLLWLLIPWKPLGGF